MSGTGVRKVEGADTAAAILTLLSRAFFDDPLFNYLTGDRLLAQYRVLPRVFRTALADLRTDAAVRFVTGATGRPLSFAGWLGPGALPRGRFDRQVRDLRAARLLVTMRNRRVAATLLREVERRHPVEPHWYLALLATDPAAQHRGHGTAVVRPVLEQCDADLLPAYTETQRPENVSWYGRLGFEVVDELRIKDGPPIWRLWRAPDPGGPFLP